MRTLLDVFRTNYTSFINIISVLGNLYFFKFEEHGVEYEFRVFARNKVDYGEAAIDFLTTPDAS